jgi:hypothetical protein
LQVNHLFVYDTAGESWATPSPGNGHYVFGRNGKTYYNGEECGPALNGTSFGTIAGGYNKRTWMVSSTEPSGIISTGLTQIVKTLVSDDHVKINSTVPLTDYGWQVDFCSKQRWCLTGDFDIQLRYENRSCSGGSDGGTPMLRVYIDENTWVYMRRGYGNSHDASTITNGGWATYNTAGFTDTYGRLRIVRVGNIFTCYYWNNGTSAWVLLHTSPSNAAHAKPATVEILVYGYGSLTITRVDIFGFTINSGTVSNMAGWTREAASVTRGSRVDFPEKALIVSTREGIDILDTSTSKLWMRFIRAANNALHAAAIEPRRVVMRNGMMLVSYGNGGGGGTICIDFTTDDIRIHDLQSVAWTGARLRIYNGVYWATTGQSARDAVAGAVASRNLAGGYSGDNDNWRIPSAVVRFTDIYEDSGYLYKVHATQAGIGVHKWRRWYNEGASPEHWWSPGWFTSALTTDMWWCWVDPSDGTLYYMSGDSTPTGGAPGSIYRVAKVVWTAVATGGTFAADASVVRPSNRMWTSMGGYQGSTEAFVRGGYVYHAADEGVWRIASDLSGSWGLYVGPVGSGAVLDLLPADMLGVSAAEFCKDDAGNLLLVVDCVRRGGRYQIYVIKMLTGTLYARGKLRRGRLGSYLTGSLKPVDYTIRHADLASAVDSGEVS